MSKKPRKTVEMSKDAFQIYLTLALVLGIHLPGIYEYLAMRWS
jgi:hypothetical protein